MSDLNLQDDLVAFLRSGKELEYDPTTCEAGEMTLLPLERLKLEYFPMFCEGPDDPHAGERGCYLVKGVSLIERCDDYKPEGLLLWLPLDGRYAVWDSSHDTIGVFGPDVNWSGFLAAPARHINAQWELPDSVPVTRFVPWTRHAYNAEQVHHPLPDLVEWYEAKWLRRGAYREGIRLRFPEELLVRIEFDGVRFGVTAKYKRPEQDADWIPAVAPELTGERWQQIRPWLSAGFWDQPSMGGTVGGESETMWTVTGFRAARFHTLFRSYDSTGPGRDAVHEFGKQLARLAGLLRFDDPD